MNKYVRICRTLNTKGSLVPVEETSSTVDTDNNSDWYRSVYYYGPEAVNYFNKNHSIRGYTGKVFSDKLVFDFDAEDVNIAKNDVVELLKRLKNDGVDVRKSAVVYFSGGKGFHVEIPIGEELTPSELKTICSNIAEGLVSFDTKVYNTNRIFRLPNTKHQATNLFKIPLNIEEPFKLSVDDIKSLAKTPRKVESDPVVVSDTNFLTKYKEEKKPEKKVFIVDEDCDVRGLSTIDFTRCPKNMPRCIFALQQGIMMPGERNAAFLILASYYRNTGMDKRVAHRALKGVAELNSELYPEHNAIDKDEIWNTVISSAYSSTWKTVPGGPGCSRDNELLQKYCSLIKSDVKCCLHTEKATTNTIIQIGDISQDFSKFAENFDKNLVRTGINLIDDNMKIAIGTTTLLVGASGSGKTTAALNIMENANKLDQDTMFFSLDMHKNLIYMKLAKKVTNYTDDEILQFHKNNDLKKKQEILEAVKTKYGKTFFDFTPTMSIEDMKNKVLSVEQKSGKKIKLVVVDYASRIAGPYSDSYANARYNALMSTGVAADTEAAWIIISQVSRQTGNGQTPLRTKRAAKESGDWEESASNVITVWRPFMGQEDTDDVIRMFLAKNRMGREIERPLWWNGSKGSIRDMSEYEYQEYQAEREQVEKELLKKSFGVK